MSAQRHDFDRRADSYDANARVQKAAAAWLAEWLPARIAGPALELGSGTGIFTRLLAARAENIVATDIAPRMVNAGVNALPHARWSVSDASCPPTGDAFSWVFSCSLAQWLPDPALAFRRWHEVAAPGARLLAGWFVQGTMEKFFASWPDAAAFPWRNEAEWIALLAGAGWSLERSETKTFLAVHRSSAAMLREIHNLGAVFPRRFGPGQLRMVLRAFDRSHLREGQLETPFVFLRVEARRT